jgi:hypothetical protein
MRWNGKKLFRDGDLRFKRKFLWLPKRIGREWRWLEFGQWRERFICKSFDGPAFWQAFSWIDSKTPIE